MRENMGSCLLYTSNTDRQRERVVAAFEKHQTTAGIAEILKALYHGGNGLGSVSAWYAEDGIHLDVYKRQAHREEREKKKSVMEQLKSQPKAEHKKTAPKKSAEREI